MSTYFRLELIELINMLARSNNRSVLRMIGAVQFVHLTLCFFQRFYNIPDSVLPLFSLGVSQCVYTHQAGRTPALQRNVQSSEKSQNLKEKTQYFMNTLYVTANLCLVKKKIIARLIYIIKRSCQSHPLQSWERTKKRLWGTVCWLYKGWPKDSFEQRNCIFKNIH